MSIYRFSVDSPVGDITFRHANDRPPVGLIHAKDDIAPAALTSIRNALEEAGWRTVPASVDGRNVLQVEGFRSESQLVAFLKDKTFIKGEARITEEASDNPSRTFQEWLQDTSLKGAGWLNLVGDVSLLGSGITSGRSQEIVAGSLYTAGAGVLARYGNVKTEHHVRQVLEQTAEFLKQQAGSLPEDCGLSRILKDRRDGVISSTENFFYRYPSQAMLSAYTLGAFSMLQSGLKQGNPWGVAYGTSSVGMKAASLLIPEKQPPEEEKASAGPVGKFIHWVQEKPLRLFGFGSLVTDTLLGLSAMREYRDNPKQRSYMFKFLTTGTYMAADVLMAISSKHHVNADGGFDAEEQRGVEALIAESIMQQPKGMRETLTQHVAGFLAAQPEMKHAAADIARSIREQLAHMEKNPWVCRTASASPSVRL